MIVKITNYHLQGCIYCTTSEVKCLVKEFVITVYCHAIQCWLHDLNIVSAGCGDRFTCAGITYEYGTTIIVHVLFQQLDSFQGFYAVMHQVLCGFLACIRRHTCGLHTVLLEFAAWLKINSGVAAWIIPPQGYTRG